MRYEIDNEGYILNVFWGCNSGKCTEYTGKVPSGYDNLNEWSEKANIRAYKIVDGNLVYDAKRDKELQAQYEIEDENNSCATHKWVNEKLNKSTTIYDDNFSVETTEQYITNSNDSEIPEIIIKGNGSLTEVNGSSIYIDDARNGNAKELVIEGKSEQETSVQNDNILFFREDKITSNNSKTTYKINNYNEIECSYVGIGTYPYVALSLDNDLLTNGTWYIGGMVKEMNTPSNKVILNISKINKETGARDYYTEINFSNTELSILKSKTFVVDNLDTHYYSVRLYINTNVAGTEGISYNANFADVFISKINSFVPSTPNSPSPDYPSKIKTTPSIRNLFDKDITPNDYYYNNTGTTSGMGGSSRFINQKIIAESRTYIVSYKGRYSKVNGSTDTAYVRFVEYKNDGTFISRTLITENNKTITLNKETAYFILSVDTKPNAYFEELMIEEGIIAHSYVPYGSWAKVKITGKNFIKFSDVSEKTIDGIKFSVNDNIITLNGQSSVNYANNILTSEKVNLSAIKNENYTVSYHVVNGTKNVKLGISFRDVNNNQLDFMQDANATDLSVTKTLSAETIKNTKYIVFYVRTQEELNNLQIKIQLEEGTATKYEEHKEKEVLIDLQDNELCSIKDVKDELNIIDEQVVIDKKIGKVVFDGSEDWVINKPWNTSYPNLFHAYTIVTNTSKNQIAIADKFKISSGHTEEIIFKERSYAVYIFLKADRLSSYDLAGFKEYLSNNNVTMYHELEEPQQITLPNTNIELFEGVNHITLVDDLETNMTLNYISQSTRFEDGLKLHVTNENVLINEAITTTSNGLTMTVNDDKTITLSGTATADTEFILNGSIDNIEPIFMLNNSNQFTVSGLNENVSLNLYNYNGTDRELVYSGTGGNIVIGEPKCITCSTLAIANGTKVNVIVNPSIILNGGDYVEAKANTFITTEPFELKQDEYIKVDRSYIKVIGEDETILKVIEPLKTFKPNTLIQTNSNDVSLTTKYFNDEYINDRLTKIETDQENIRIEATKKYSTKEETEEAKEEAIESANSNTDDKLKDYSTTTEMNAAINVSANAINQTVSATYSTKDETANAKTEAINSANTSTDTKLQSYSTTTEMNSVINQTAQGINTEVAKKVNATEIISKINQSAEEVQINANKIKLEGYTTINNGFVVDTNGNMICNNATINSTTMNNATIQGANSRLKIQTNQTFDDAIVITGLFGGSLPTEIKIGNYFSYYTVYDTNGSVLTQMVLSPAKITVPTITAGNIDSGRCTLTSSGDRTVYFNKTFSNPPNVVLTPLTKTNGVIAGKIAEITTTYFKANIGGSNFGDNEFCWIAISD